jgi:hypothetical protein
MNDWTQKTKDEEEIIRLAEVGDKDAVTRLIPYLKIRELKDTAIWALGWVGPRAKAAVSELEAVYGWELQHGADRRAGEAIERIFGCEPGSG